MMETEVQIRIDIKTKVGNQVVEEMNLQEIEKKLN